MTKLVNRQPYAEQQYAHLYFEVEMEILKVKRSRYAVEQLTFIQTGSNVSANVTKLLASDVNRVSLLNATGDCGVVRDHLFHEVRPASPFAVKIGDFGLAHFADDPDDLTVRVWTGDDAAPQLRSGAANGPESDFYSLGVMLQVDLERVFGTEVSLIRPCFTSERGWLLGNNSYFLVPAARGESQTFLANFGQQSSQFLSCLIYIANSVSSASQKSPFADSPTNVDH